MKEYIKPSIEVINIQAIGMLMESMVVDPKEEGNQNQAEAPGLLDAFETLDDDW